MENYLLPSHQECFRESSIEDSDASVVGLSFMAFQSSLALHQRLESVKRLASESFKGRRWPTRGPRLLPRRSRLSKPAPCLEGPSGRLEEREGGGGGDLGRDRRTSQDRADLGGDSGRGDTTVDEGGESLKGQGQVPGGRHRLDLRPGQVYGQGFHHASAPSGQGSYGGGQRRA